MKKTTVIITAALCGVCLIAGAAASSFVQKIQAELRPDFTIVIDGEKQVFKNANGEVVKPILHNGTTYLPVRAIGEMMGKTVYWYEEEKKIELKDKASTVTDADVIVYESDKEKGKSEGAIVTIPHDEKNNDTPITTPSISPDEAKLIALEKAGLSADEVIFTEKETDLERGKTVYEIEFRHGKTEYSAEIDANDGSIVSWEVEND